MVKPEDTLQDVVQRLRLKNTNTLFGQRLMDRRKTKRVPIRQGRRARGAATVFILTYCRDLSLFYGTELIFKTLRVGFPNAKIVVVDNASLPESRTKIQALAEENDCLFEQIPPPGVVHHQFIQNTISSMAENGTAEHPLIFLDPDICLWQNCEDFDFDGLIAGRMIGGYEDRIMQTYLMPRVHTSFMWIPSARKLQDAIWKIKARHYDFEPFLSYSTVMNGKWYRYNTGAGLYAALSDRVSAFTTEHFDCYDHIFCGSHFDLLCDHYDAETGKKMRKIHDNARQGNLQALRGIWKHQMLKTPREEKMDDPKREEVYANNE